MEILNKYKSRYEDKQPESISIQEYLQLCKEDSNAYASAPERMLMAIGESKVVDTSKDPRRSRIFSNRKIKTYETFKGFYGMEQTIENVVSYFRHASQGLEEAKQILYLLGPVGSAKSSLAERLKALFEKVPFYTIEAYNAETKKMEMSPVLESPLWLFDEVEDGETLTSIVHAIDHGNAVAGQSRNSGVRARRRASCAAVAPTGDSRNGRRTRAAVEGSCACTRSRTSHGGRVA